MRQMLQPPPADTINAGYGNDTITLAGSNEAVLAAVTIDGGTDENGKDNDILILNSAAIDFVDKGFANIKGIETLQITGASSLGVIGTSVGLGANALATGITKVITGTGDETGVVIVSDNAITVDGSALSTTAVNGLTLAGAGAIKATVGPSAIKIDASAATGTLVLTGNAATATITGGSGADFITSGGASDTLTGGAGLDTIVAGAGTDTVVIGNTADSLDTIIGFTGGANADKIKLGGETAAVGKTVAQIAPSTEKASVVFSDLAPTKTIIIGGVTITAGASIVVAASIAAGFENLSAGATPSITGATVTGSLTGWTTGAKSTATVVFTSTTAGRDISPNLADTGNGSSSAVTITAGGAVNSGVAHNIVFDTAENLGALGVNLGNHVGATNLPTYAVASDTGAIYFDADGNWTTGAVQIGTIGIVAGLTASDNFTVA